MGEAEGFREYVSGRMEGWRRAAYQMCGNWHTADDLVSIALVKVLRHWMRVSAAGDPDAYVRRILLRTAIDEHRGARQRESPVGIVPEPARDVVEPDGVTDRQTLVALLNGLPPGKREVVVLRYVYDLSVEETAARLGCSLGTVKSQTARALETMRAALV